MTGVFLGKLNIVRMLKNHCRMKKKKTTKGNRSLGRASKSSIIRKKTASPKRFCWGTLRIRGAGTEEGNHRRAASRACVCQQRFVRFSKKKRMEGQRSRSGERRRSNQYDPKKTGGKSFGEGGGNVKNSKQGDAWGIFFKNLELMQESPSHTGIKNQGSVEKKFRKGGGGKIIRIKRDHKQEGGKREMCVIKRHRKGQQTQVTQADLKKKRDY